MSLGEKRGFGFSFRGLSFSFSFLFFMGGDAADEIVYSLGLG